MNKSYDKKTIEDAVSKSFCYADVFRNLNISINGGSYPWLKNLINKFELSTDHFSPQARAKRSQTIKAFDGVTDLSNGERIHTQTLVSFLLFNNETYNCSKCQLTEWLGDSITLDVDHIDNDPTNNHISNLCFICPNCHRQKTTKHNESKKIKKYCVDCGCSVHPKSTRCSKCNRFYVGSNSKGKERNNRKFNPSKEELQEVINSDLPMTEIGKKYDVSDNAVRQRCKVFGIKYEKRKKVSGLKF